jgi:hypothetical protein
MVDGKRGSRYGFLLRDSSEVGMKSSIGIIVGFILLLLANHFLAEEPHHHEQVYYKTVGVTEYYVTMCHTEQAQVLASGKHIQNKRSEEYFR